MASVKRMTELAQEISEKTKIITDYLSARGLEAASFDVEGLAEFPIPSEDEIAHNARKELVGATKELHDIAQGPKESLRTLAWDVSYLCNLFLFCSTLEDANYSVTIPSKDETHTKIGFFFWGVPNPNPH